MQTKKIIIATLVGAITLFLFDGLLQAIPGFGVTAVKRIETNKLTTPEFNDLNNHMSYIVTDNTVSFVATKSASYYNISRFFVVEFISALLIALLFAIVFAKINLHSLRQRLMLTIYFACITCIAIHFSYFNWWGFSLAYTAGVALKTIFGWLLISFIQNRFIYKIK
jgi:hypothetical protein